MIFILMVIFQMVCCKLISGHTYSCETRNETDFPFQYNVCTDSITLENESVSGELTLEDVKCQTDEISTFAAQTTNHFSCVKLHPCTKYIVHIHAHNKTSNETEKLSHYITTLYVAPITELKTLDPNAVTIDLLWSVTHQTCVKGFTIKADAKDSNVEKTCGPKDTEIKIDGVRPCKDYNITLITTDFNDVSTDITNKTKTAYTDPGPVTEPKINVTKEHSAIITWSKPEDASCANFYDIQWKSFHCTPFSRNDCPPSFQNVSAETLSTKLENLEECTTYHIAIRVNGDDINTWADNFSTPFEVPGPIEEFTVVPGSTNMSLSWKQPKLQRFCVRRYNINVTGIGVNLTVLCDDTRELIGGLKPCAKYNISIAAVSLEGILGEIVSENHTTDYAKPDAVHTVEIIPSENQLFVKWEPPKLQDLCISSYRIAVWEKVYDGPRPDNVYDNTTNQTHTVIPKLDSCVTYTVQIIPVTSSDPAQDGVNYFEDATTKPAILDAPKVEPENATHDSLQIRAEIETGGNRCPILYVRFRCEAVGGARIEYGETTICIEHNKQNLTATVEPLSPYKDYNCIVNIFNIQGWSPNASTTIKTTEYYPEEPTNVQAESISSTSISIKWSEPIYSNGKISFYQLYIQTIGPKYKVPSYCSPFIYQNFSQIISVREFQFHDAFPYIEYSIQIAAVNEFGTGDYTNSVAVVTKPDVSQRVKLRSPVTTGPQVGEPYSASVTVTWGLPCAANGEIISFEGEFNGIRDEKLDYDHFAWSMDVNESMLEASDYLQYIETRLKPEYHYTVSVVVIIKGVNASSRAEYDSFESPAGIPSPGVVPGFTDVDTIASKNPTSSAVVRFSSDMLRSDMGTIRFVALLLSEKNCQPDPLLKTNMLNSQFDWPEVPGWMDAYQKDCIIQYQTTPKRWSPTYTKETTEIRNFRTEVSQMIEYYVGTDDCNSSEKDKNETVYCNGPLKSDTSYLLVVRLFTSSGYSDVSLSTFQTDAVVKWYLVTLLVLSFLLLAFVSGFIYLFVTKKIVWQDETSQGVVEQTGDISASNFLTHYEVLSKAEKVQREFKELTAVTNDLNLENSASKMNESKNRYTNIFPYDKNRVILDVDEEGSDYINASFINGYKHKKEFIATQGPKPESFIDFWKMVLQHNVYIIVMVTRLKEGETIKCHQYFPHLHEEMQFGNNVSVSCIRETSFDTHVKREFKVEHTGEAIRKPVIHFHFKKWPDHECPNDPTDLINFIRVVRTEKIPSHSPITVHCSAGVGRTGTFIALDIIMQRLKNENKINIFETVKKLRFQRMRMVQTAQQYQFLYACTHELVKNKRPSRMLRRKSKVHNAPTAGPVRQSFNPNDIESAM